MVPLDTLIDDRLQLSLPKRSAAATLPQVGNWQIGRCAGHGQWAGVYRGRPANAPLDQSAGYAIKMLHESRQHDPSAMAMLAREAQIGRRVSHPHLIAILDSQTKRAPQYLVMPWLEGATLQAYIAAQRLFDPPAVLWIARQTAEGLAALDRSGWMHGDIKPSNLFLSPRGHVTLLDLGFARHRDDREAVPRAIAGSGYYIAPEHVTSVYRPDIRSDIYSLGVVIYQLLAGQLPLEGETFEEVAAAHKQTAPLNLRRIAPHVPSRVVELVHRMLAKDPLRRPQSPAELVEVLVRLEIETFSERAS